METLAYLATIVGITLPALIGFLVIGLIVAGMILLGGEVDHERDKDKKLRHQKRL